MKGKKVYIVLEEYNNDGEIKSSVLGVFDTMEKAYNKLEEQIEVYKNWNEARALKDFEKADIYRNMLVNWEII